MTSEIQTEDKYYSQLTFAPIDHTKRLAHIKEQIDNKNNVNESSEQIVMIEGENICFQWPFRNLNHEFVTPNSVDYLTFIFGLVDSSNNYCEPKAKNEYLATEYGDIYEKPFGIFLCATRYFTAEHPKVMGNESVYLNFMMIPSSDSSPTEFYLKSIEYKEFLKQKSELLNNIPNDSTEYKVFVHQVLDVKKLRYLATNGKSNIENISKVVDQHGSVVPTPTVYDKSLPLATAASVSSIVDLESRNNIQIAIPIVI